MGKTNLVHRFVKASQDTKNISPTIGVEFGTRMITLSDHKKIKTQIWDTGKMVTIKLGRNNIDRLPLRKSDLNYRHYRKALGAIVVYDITKERTFINVRRWIESIRDQADPNVVITLVGNKIDLRERQEVSTM